MNRKLTLLILVIAIGFNVFSQTNLPIIKANSSNVDILDRTLKEKEWRIVPKYRPDIYYTSNVSTPIVFYTDVDSISVQLKPDEVFNFIILVNGKDSAYTQIKYKKSNLEVLKEAWEYNFNDKSILNKYSYNLPDSPDLLTLKKQFKLDSIAGKGNELSKILNLLLWVNHSFIYDGTKESPAFESISELMTKCKNGEGTLHCGAMAWVLSACYLSMGLKAKQVVCFPKDSTDFECHSTIAVYSQELKKWLFVDPSNCAYAMNNNNEIMSFEELREAMVNEKTIKLNKEANRNGNQLLPFDYLDYLSKNFYAFQCFSDVDGESISNLLLPIEYKGNFTHTVQNHPKVTHNPKEFWKEPEN